MNIFLLLTAAVFFPSVPELWKQGPLTEAVMKIPQSEIVASHGQLDAQQRLFRQLQSPGLRSRMALEFGNAGNPEAFRILVRLLSREKDPFVRDDLLNAMLRLKKNGCAVPDNGDWLVPYFKAESPAARSAAMLLYLTNAKSPDPAAVINALRGETSALVLNRLAEALRPFANQLDKTQIAGLYDETPQENILLRALAGEIAALQSDPDGSAVVSKALKDPSAVVRMRTARGLAWNPDAMKTLATAAQDGHPAVRLEAARMIFEKADRPADAEREKILLTLLKDPSAGVRAAAAGSLVPRPNAEGPDPLADTTSENKTSFHGRLRNAGATELLAEAIADPEIAVRREVAASLIRLDPDEPIRRKVVETAENHVDARRQALTFLAGVRDRTRTEVIVRWTEESKDPLFLTEAVRAAGVLRLTGFTCCEQPGIEGRLPRDPDQGKLPCKEYRTALAFMYGQLLHESMRAAKQHPGDTEAAKRAEYWKKTAVPALIRLSSDPDAGVAAEALMSIYRNPDCRAQFAPALVKMLRNRKDGWSDCRAIACRALAGWKLPARSIGDLTTLTVKPCIRIPQSEPQLDTDAVRISALLLLRDQSEQGNRAAGEAFRKAMELLEKADADSELKGPELDEFLRQVKAAAAGMSANPKRIEAAEPAFSTAPASDKP